MFIRLHDVKTCVQVCSGMYPIIFFTDSEEDFSGILKILCQLLFPTALLCCVKISETNDPTDKRMHG